MLCSPGSLDGSVFRLYSGTSDGFGRVHQSRPTDERELHEPDRAFGSCRLGAVHVHLGIAQNRTSRTSGASFPPVDSLPQLAGLSMALPISPALQRLDCLDKSSPEFHDQFTSVLYGREYMQCVSNVQDDDLVWLVDYLGEVRYHVALLRSLFKPSRPSLD